MNLPHTGQNQEHEGGSVSQRRIYVVGIYDVVVHLLHRLEYICTYIHTYIHTYMHTYMHTYIQACMYSCRATSLRRLLCG